MTLDERIDQLRKLYDQLAAECDERMKSLLPKNASSTERFQAYIDATAAAVLRIIGRGDQAKYEKLEQLEKRVQRLEDLMGGWKGRAS